jgi:hypothetical protein
VTEDKIGDTRLEDKIGLEEEEGEEKEKGGEDTREGKAPAPIIGLKFLFLDWIE